MTGRKQCLRRVRFASFSDFGSRSGDVRLSRRMKKWCKAMDAWSASKSGD
jgi:hypothetical protein